MEVSDLKGQLTGRNNSVPSPTSGPSKHFNNGGSGSYEDDLIVQIDGLVQVGRLCTCIGACAVVKLECGAWLFFKFPEYSHWRPRQEFVPHPLV